VINNIRFSTYDKFVILQVQTLPPNAGFYSEQNLAWRDAKVEDLLEVAEHFRDRYAQQIHDLAISSVSQPQG